MGGIPVGGVDGLEEGGPGVVPLPGPHGAQRQRRPAVGRRRCFDGGVTEDVTDRIVVA